MTQGRAAIDPLGDHFTLDAFESLAQRHGALPVGTFLLDHDVLTRMTPELAAHVIERAQLPADRPMAGLSRPELHRLHRAIRDVMGRALEGHHGYES
jgi:formamidopyrimidine-DNA glycosylase